MSITYKTSGVFVFIWATLAMVTAVIELEDSPANTTYGNNYEQYINRTANPEEINMSDPNVGYQATNPISTVVSYGKMAGGWLTFMAKSAMLDSPIWESWSQPLRYFLMAMSAPYLMFITISVAGMLVNAIGGLFGRAFP